MKDRVTVLITAESIIAGFMIAYGALNGQLLAYWSRHGGRLMGTYIAGIVIDAVVLTCFASIVLLFNSIPTTTNRNKGRYYAGYDLFLMAILGSIIFVVANGFSIYHFTVGPNHTPIYINVRPLADLLFYAFLVYAVVLIMLLPMMLICNCKVLLLFFVRAHCHALFIVLFVAAMVLGTIVVALSLVTFV